MRYSGNSDKYDETVKLLFAIVLLALLYYVGIGCPFRFFLGISCPGCGMTRAIVSVFKLKFKEAFTYHPLWPLAVVLLAAFLLGELSIIKPKVSKKLKITLIFFVAFIFVLTYTIRIVLKDPIVVPDVKPGFVYKLLSNIFNILR